MNDIVFHQASEKLLVRFAGSPSHALLLFGPEGIGKSTVSLWLARRLLGLGTAEALQSYPHFVMIQPDSQSVSIESIRELNRFTKLKIANPENSIKRLAIIDHAEMMTTEAQNALLKLLEEPPADTILILNTSSELSLLATIRSRSQVITIQPPEYESLAQHFSDLNFQQAAIKQAYLMSGGLPGLMHALLSEKEEHPLSKAAQTARRILQTDAFTKLVEIDALSKQRQESLRVVIMIKQMAHAAISQNALKENVQAIKKWHAVLQAAYAAESSLRSNAQPKLVLTDFALQILLS